MLLSKRCSIEMNDSMQDDTPAERVSEGITNQVKLPACGNDVVKQEMAVALIAQGVSEEAVCRLLHIDSELLPDNN